MNNIKSVMKWIVLLVAVYLTIITWNARTGSLNRFSSEFGLNIVGSILYPGNWLHNKIKGIWSDYIDLRDVREENKKLKKEIKTLELENISLKYKAREWERLRELLKFKPIKGWDLLGARVILYKTNTRLLNTLFVDVGEVDGVKNNLPVLTSRGLVGQILKTSYKFSMVLLISDSNARIPVISAEHRVKGVMQGMGKQDIIQVKYIPITASISMGEEFVTSGVGGVFPKGIPVGFVISIKNDPTSLFKQVLLKPYVDLSNLEEVLILKNKFVSPLETQEQ